MGKKGSEEIMPQRAPTSWVYDLVEHYRLNSSIIQNYLQQIFGDYDFEVTVSLRSFRELDLVTDFFWA